jgi:hypothetical protein
MSEAQTEAGAVLDRLHRAMNAHDLDALVGCFDDAYSSEQPAHPARVFQGKDQVGKNWAALFAGMPDFQADLLQHTVDGNDVWAEWHWHGTHADGTRTEMRGMTIFGVREGRIVSARLYMEPVEVSGADIDTSVKTMAEGAKG